MKSPWLPASHPVAPALTTPIRVGVAVVVTRPLPLSPLHTAPDGAEAHTVIALFTVSPPRGELHSPWGSTVAVIQERGPLVWTVGDWRPKPASPTAAPAGNGLPAVGSATAFTAGPLRSSGVASAITATSSGTAAPTRRRPGGRGSG